MNAVSILAKSVGSGVETGALCGIADTAIAEAISQELVARGREVSVTITENLSDLVERLVQSPPRVVLLEDRLVQGAKLVEFLLQVCQNAPVILISAADPETKIGALITAGRVEFVPRHGEFASLAASLMLRHLNVPATIASLGAPDSASADDIAEIFRHDINNPLTGILGNAELVLSHSSKLPPADIARLQTVVELAVRLRETIRQLSDGLQLSRER